MNREFLQNLGLEKETIDKIMAEHGKAIQAVKPADYDELKTEKATLEQKLTDLQKIIDTQKEKLSSIEDLKKEIETYKLKDLKTSIAIQAGIPFELAGRLNGQTEEEIKADAEKIAGFVNKKPTLPLKTTEPPQVDEKEQAYAKILENLKGE
ncbi:phage scaffolding protein [Caldibacillus thermoamylovorans]|uniref:phage scaffolding protein n=1 Tax=Caldibacillus thermoamylovorans TaxID=35841 RepID=UPI001D060920|nr:phage scaffolding protein [Caldibacillus thermoamylovorans]MCB5934488.1 phage scaffolding protein [Bacillus sp. DFI.2.34]MCB7076463.1 phage scaffolding protein [Caldibacillus thermoamylovorans]